MVDITVRTRINRPVEEVFAYVTDAANDQAWRSDVVEARGTTEEPIGKGTTYHFQFTPFMGESEGTAELVEFQSNRSVVFRGEMGRFNTTTIYLFDFNDGATNLTWKFQSNLPGAMRLMKPVFWFLGRKWHTKFLASLKRILEQESAT